MAYCAGIISLPEGGITQLRQRYDQRPGLVQLSEERDTLLIVIKSLGIAPLRPLHIADAHERKAQPPRIAQLARDHQAFLG
jgi:hypothetical protein